MENDPWRSLKVMKKSRKILAEKVLEPCMFNYTIANLNKTGWTTDQPTLKQT